MWSCSDTLMEVFQTHFIVHIHRAEMRMTMGPMAPRCPRGSQLPTIFGQPTEVVVQPGSIPGGYIDQRSSKLQPRSSRGPADDRSSGPPDQSAPTSVHIRGSNKSPRKIQSSLPGVRIHSYSISRRQTSCFGSFREASLSRRPAASPKVPPLTLNTGIFVRFPKLPPGHHRGKMTVPPRHHTDTSRTLSSTPPVVQQHPRCDSPS